ncbi:hypothetical protein TrispH2_001615 [Trichoplax sp. H2]|nr:hypothetical protein TrispH2_001615 [Trichoplax sp. H2]|eukprot:RDD46923.1 hypothetical protein TrispH2_001615 [Trichoplax sp. H2]
MQPESQAERLTSKHIKTLNYLQLILKQKGELENKIADLEDQLADANENIRLADRRFEELKRESEDGLEAKIAELESKHQAEVVQLMKGKLEVGKQWQNEVQNMRDRVKTLEEENKALLAKTKLANQYEDKIKELFSELDRAIKKIEDLKLVNEKVLQEKNKIREESNSYYEKVKSTKQSLKMSTQRIEELERQIKMKEEIIKEETAQVNILSEKILFAGRENQKLISSNKELQKKVKKRIHQMEELENSTVSLREERSVLADQVSNLSVDLERMNNLYAKAVNPSMGGHFKEFVKLRRDFNNLREENDTLHCKLRVKMSNYLPLLKASVTFKSSTSNKLHNNSDVTSSRWVSSNLLK